MNNTKIIDTLNIITYKTQIMLDITTIYKHNNDIPRAISTSRV